MTRVSAPGKMVLLGEYAVLFGAPALVAAVNRRATVELQPSSTAFWTVSAPGLIDLPAEFEIENDGTPRWLDEKDRENFILVDSLIRGLAKHSLVDLKTSGPLEMVLDTQAFFETTVDGREKLGLGSSAALTVALTTALVVHSGGRKIVTGESGLQAVIELHREMQGGRGSGVDVAASFHGGLTRFQLESRARAIVSPMVFPESLRWKAFWTGTSASTGSFLERLQERREQSPASVDGVIDRLGAIARSGVDALETRDPAAFLRAVDLFWTALGDLGSAIEMPIVSEPHLRLRELAENCGVSYKPSGAGGGDLGVGFATEPQSLVRLSEAVRDAGLSVLDLDIASRGVVLEEP